MTEKQLKFELRIKDKNKVSLQELSISDELFVGFVKNKINHFVLNENNKKVSRIQNYFNSSSKRQVISWLAYWHKKTNQELNIQRCMEILKITRQGVSNIVHECSDAGYFIVKTKVNGTETTFTTSDELDILIENNVYDCINNFQKNGYNKMVNSYIETQDYMHRHYTYNKKFCTDI